jgi:hypothetical protein
MRRISILALAITFISSGLFASPAFAAVQIACSGSGTFTLESNVVTVGTACTGIANIPEGVTGIDPGAFDGQPVSEIKIPSTMVSILPQDTMVLLPSLLRITVSANNSTYSSDAQGVLFDKNKRVLWRYPAGKPEVSYSIPISVTTIGDSAFSGAQFKGVSIPNTVITLGTSSFFGSNLESVVIPASVITVRSNSFKNNSQLSVITFAGGPPGPADSDGVFDSIFPFAILLLSTAKQSEWGSELNTRFYPMEQYGYVVTYDANGGIGNVPSPQWKGSFSSDSKTVTPPATTLTKSLFSFTSWNTLANGNGVDYPVDVQRKLNSDLTLYAQWTENPRQAVAGAVKLKITGTAVATTAGTNVLTANRGSWDGYPAPTYTYQWYSCTKAVSAAIEIKGSTKVPTSCSAISAKTVSRLPVLRGYVGKYLAVKVTGTSTGTNPTSWLSKSSTAVR